ncbi:MAG: galactonate dehydratase [Candidatus Latescibacteria bacterium]|nr:galactonate dehydratase [Candidatus Latescibacterota bacterium]
MKITGVDTLTSWAGLRNWVLVKVRTDTELFGWGEATLEGYEDSVVACVQQLAGRLVGQDALAVEHVWQQLYRHSFWRGGPVHNSALAALDQALWDLRGKAWGVPVYRLLGGPVRQQVRLYTHVGIYQPQRMVEDAQRDVEDGFTAMKTGAWAGDTLLAEPERIGIFAERIGLLRQSLGPAVDIMVDDHGRGRPSSALRLMRALEPFKLLFFEEAVQPDDLEGLELLRAAAPQVDLAAGERLFSKWDFRPVLEKRLVDVIQPDLCHAGGISEVKKIAALAEAYYVLVAPHNPQGPVSTAACAHLALAIPNFLILEYVRQKPFRDQALREAWVVDKGCLQVPDRPGLGVDLDEEALLTSPMHRHSGPVDCYAADGSVRDV